MFSSYSLVILSFFWCASLCAGDVLWYEDVLQFVNETRELASPARRYCDGVASVADNYLYETPRCDDGSTKSPLLNASLVDVELVQVANLSFCCKSNYTAVLPVGTNITVKDEEARFLYEQMINKTLWRYDCSTFYPLRTCAPCAYAYRSWVCSMVFPLGCRVETTDLYGYSAIQQVSICRGVCLEVMRKCPATFNVRCPTAEYRTPGIPDGFTNTSSFGAAGCNRADHNLNSAVAYSSSIRPSTFIQPNILLMILGALVALLFV